MRKTIGWSLIIIGLLGMFLVALPLENDGNVSLTPYLMREIGCGLVTVIGGQIRDRYKKECPR
jgi:hypothetical protein